MGLININDRIFDRILAASRDTDKAAELKALSEGAQGKHPDTLADPTARQARKNWLDRTHGDELQLKTFFERIIRGNELQPVNYLAHGTVAARPICRISIVGPSGSQGGYATGFLIAPGVMLTNNHVFPDAVAATRSKAEFDYELDVFDRSKTKSVFTLRPDRLFLTSVELDFSVLAVEPISENGTALDSYSYLPLIKDPNKAVEGEWLTIIQHPGGELKQLCVRENKFLKRDDDLIWYSTDTTGGSSGSPVFNNSWQVVALHHMGVPQTKNGVIQTIKDEDFDRGRHTEADIKWIANEGIRISRVIEEMGKKGGDQPLLRPVFEMTVEKAQALVNRRAAAMTTMAAPVISSLVASGAARSPSVAAPSSHTAPNAAPSFPPIARTDPAMPRSITVTLDIGDDGRVSLRQPAGGAVESFTIEAERSAARKARRPADIDVPFDPDYKPTGKRKGFDPAFLGAGFEVQLPDLGALKQDATPLIEKPGRHGQYVLDYRGYSLVMHAKRKLAIYTAANIDGDHRYQLGRPDDQWRFDPRIPRSAQIGPYYYANNQFDRGHLTRYEDMEYGPTRKDALVSAADTLHFTNCAPQHAKFNQSRLRWQGLEQHVLEQSIELNEFRALVFTGPVLDEGDPVWERFKNIQYPVRFWKIAVALTSQSKLFAAGFILDQSKVIADFGIEATVPFTDFDTAQVPIAEIERLTGLTFSCGPTGRKSLSDVDPLRDGSRLRRTVSRARVNARESTAALASLPPGYLPIEDPSDMVLAD